MSRTINKVTLYGNVGSDPEIKQLQNGKIASFSLATSTGGYKKKDGTDIPEKTAWHRIKVFGPLVEMVEKYIHKGSKPIIEGRIEYGEFTKQDGTKCYTTDIVATDISLTGDKGTSQSAPAPAAQPAPAQPAQTFPPQVDNSAANDLPF